MSLARLQGEVVAAHIQMVHGDAVYAHLAAANDVASKIGASYALYYAELEYFADKVRWMDWGGEAGLAKDGSLSSFKRGWSTHTRPVYFCSRIFNIERYDEIATPKAFIRRAISPPTAQESSIRRFGLSDADTPVMLLHRMAGGFSATQILSTAAKLHIADHIGDTSRSAADLAGVLGADPGSLHGFLRMLVALKLLSRKDGCFGLSTLGQFLRSDHPQSVHERLIYIGEISYPVAAAMTVSVRTGKPAFDHVFGEPFFDYFAHNPELSAIFSRLMSQSVTDRIAGIVRAYDFSRMKTIVDIGGGDGAFCPPFSPQILAPRASFLTPRM